MFTPLCLQAIYPVVSQSDQTPPDAHVCTDQAHTETILQAVSIYCTLTQGVIFLLMYVQCTLYNRNNSSVSLYSVYIIQSCILPIIPSMMMWGAHNQQRRKLSIMLFSWGVVRCIFIWPRSFHGHWLTLRLVEFCTRQCSEILYVLASLALGAKAVFHSQTAFWGPRLGIDNKIWKIWTPTPQPLI